MSRTAESRAYYEANAERIKARVRAYRAANREKISAYNKAYHERNAEILSADQKEYRTKNVEKWRAYNQKHYSNNRGACVGRVRRYQAAKMERVPSWADHVLIADIYKYAAIMREHGVDCHVDHEVPLRGKLVSGLHTDSNLTVLLAEDNLRKGNRVRQTT